jgi:hypothetical protein
MKQLAAIAILGLWSGVAQATQTCVPPAPACNAQVPATVPLLAHGTIPAGTVTVSNDTTNLYVTFATIPDWTITRADVAVSKTLAGIPQKNGQPDIKNFPYSQTFCPGATCVIFTIPLGTIQQGDTLFIAAHASLDSPTQGHKQAWAAGTLFPGSAACKPGGGCGDDHSGLGMGTSNGGGECDDSATRPKSLLNDGGGDGGHGDDEGDRCSGDDDGHGEGGDAIIVINNGGGDDDHGGGQKCGGSGGHDHGDSSHGHVQNGDGGGDGGGGDDHHGDDDKDKGDCKRSQCGATYFTYVVNCTTIIE